MDHLPSCDHTHNSTDPDDVLEFSQLDYNTVNYNWLPMARGVSYWLRPVHVVVTCRRLLWLDTITSGWMTLKLRERKIYFKILTQYCIYILGHFSMHLSSVVLIRGHSATLLEENDDEGWIYGGGDSSLCLPPLLWTTSLVSVYFFSGAAGVYTQLQPLSQGHTDKGFELLSLPFSMGIKANRSNNAGGGVFMAEEDTLKRPP